MKKETKDLKPNLRIIVLTYDRHLSLNKCLNHLDQIDMDGDDVVINIFVDKNPLVISNKTLKHFNKTGHHLLTTKVAEAFSGRHPDVKIHYQPNHVGLYGQWIDSLIPGSNKQELALFLEDDVDVSPHAWKWLKAAYHQYRNQSDVFGFSLMGNAIVAGKEQGRRVNANPKHNAFMYKLIGSHGLAPLPHVWQDFRAWYHNVSTNAKFKPYVPGIAQTSWYKGYEKRKLSSTMWTMWPIYYSWMVKKFIVYPNIIKMMKPKMGETTKGELVVHRAEKGMHSKRANAKADNNLLQIWNSSFVKFPCEIEKFDWTGKIIEQY